MLPAWTTSATKLVAMGCQHWETPPKSLRSPLVNLLESVCHPMLNAICSSASRMLPGQKAAGTARPAATLR